MDIHSSSPAIFGKPPQSSLSFRFYPRHAGFVNPVRVCTLVLLKRLRPFGTDQQEARGRKTPPTQTPWRQSCPFVSVGSPARAGSNSVADDPSAGAGSPPPSLPPGAGGARPGQPPFGSSPATNPQASQGNEAAAVARIDVVVKLLAQTLPLAGTASELGGTIMDVLKKLQKYVPQGQVSPGLQQSQIQALLAKQQQAGPQIAQMRGAPGAGAGGPPPGAGAPPSPPPG